MSKRRRHDPTGRSPRVKTASIAIALAAAFGIGAAVFAGRSDDGQPQVSATGDKAAAAAPARHSRPVVDVYKSRTCGCCAKWVEHLRAQGFTVRTTDTEELASLKAKHGVPGPLQSCHTAVVDGYVIEGHVPAADVQRLLRERPRIAGLAVGGMPIGSPGMEVASGRTEPYDVVAFEKGGTARVFARHE